MHITAAQQIFYVMVGVPVYVLSVFATTALAPNLSGIRTEEPVGSVTVSFVGDMMFDRYIRERAQITGYESILSDVKSLFASSSIVVGNVEGPITTFDSVSDYTDPGPNHYRFTFATTVASVLRDTGFTAVSVGNNHILNFGALGVEQTKKWLSEQHLGYMGVPDDVYLPYRITQNGVPVVLYAYDLWNGADADELSRRISGESKKAFVIVYAHWGEEYESLPTLAQQRRARQFVDSGADFVVGSHPHVIQPKEQYGTTWIYYSLGNFVFDQYFESKVRCGAVVTIIRHPDGTVSAKEDFIQLAKDGRTVVSDCATSVPLLEK